MNIATTDNHPSPSPPDLSIDRSTGAIYGGPPISEAATFQTTVSGLGSASGKGETFTGTSPVAVLTPLDFFSALRGLHRCPVLLPHHVDPIIPADGRFLAATQNRRQQCAFSNVRPQLLRGTDDRWFARHARRHGAVPAKRHQQPSRWVVVFVGSGGCRECLDRTNAVGTWTAVARAGFVSRCMVEMHLSAFECIPSSTDTLCFDLLKNVFR